MDLADFQTSCCLIISSSLCIVQTHRECLESLGLRDEERKRVSREVWGGEQEGWTYRIHRGGQARDFTGEPLLGNETIS